MERKAARDKYEAHERVFEQLVIKTFLRLPDVGMVTQMTECEQPFEG